MVVRGPYLELDTYDSHSTGLPNRVPLAAAGLVLEAFRELFEYQCDQFSAITECGPDASPLHADVILDGIIYSNRVVRFIGQAISGN